MQCFGDWLSDLCLCGGEPGSVQPSSRTLRDGSVLRFCFVGGTGATRAALIAAIVSHAPVSVSDAAVRPDDATNLAAAAAAVGSASVDVSVRGARVRVQV
jgi:hypothetical protein